MEKSQDKPQPAIVKAPRAARPQAYYDAIKTKFAEERDLRLNYRPEGTAQYTSELTGPLARYAIDAFSSEVTPREPINDTVECLFIGGGFSALLTSARLRERGVESIRIVERGADVGGTWYWNRYPGVACDVVAYDYLPLLDEMDYVPKDHYAKGPEIFAHCQAIATEVQPLRARDVSDDRYLHVWNEAEQMWDIATDRGDRMKARFVICANGTLSKPKLAKINGMETFKGHSFHTSRWDYEYTRPDLSGLADKGRGHHRYGCHGGAGRSGPGRGVEGVVRIPAHAFLDRHPRRLADRSQLGAETQTGMASQPARACADGTAADRRAESAASRDVPRRKDSPAREREHRCDDEDPQTYR